MSADLNQALAAAQSLVEKRTSPGDPSPEPLNRLFAKLAEQSGIYPPPNLAVEICCGIYVETKRQSVEAGQSLKDAVHAAHLAYCSAMPRLSGADSIRDFIACVAHGMLIGIFPSSEGTRLLYAAQVAYSALPSPKRRKKRCKTSQKQPAVPLPTPVQSMI